MIPTYNASKPYILDLALEDLDALLDSWGEPPYRVQQIWQGLYHQFWLDPEQFSGLPLSLRRRMNEVFHFSRLQPQKISHSQDRLTTKALFELEDGVLVETVLMRYDERQTLCLSTQSGCAMECVFCATGQMGFFRNLGSGEIIEQVIRFAGALRKEALPVSNIVLMGMGEPFQNYDAVMEAIVRMNEKAGMNLGARRFTISTVGIIPGIKRFTTENTQINLAVSLHAANDALRNSLLPVNRKYPLKMLISACREYVGKSNRRITFEWALIQDINDHTEDARELAALVRGLLCHVNIIPLNPIPAYQEKQTTHSRALEFQNILQQIGIPCTIRQRRGIDIHAGCGQLAAALGERPQNPS